MLEDYKPIDSLPSRIESERLLLRAFEIQDAEEYYRLEQHSIDGHLAPYSPIKPPPPNDAEGIRTMRDQIRTTEEKWEDGLDYRFVIIQKKSGTIIGQIGITNIIHNVAQSAFIGYWIGKDYLNQGYATEALVVALHYAFEFLKLHRISLWIVPDNVASLRMAEKLKLRFEGKALKALHLGGEWKDTNIYAITSDEWNERKEELYAFLRKE